MGWGTLEGRRVSQAAEAPGGGPELGEMVVVGTERIVSQSPVLHGSGTPPGERQGVASLPTFEN